MNDKAKRATGALVALGFLISLAIVGSLINGTEKEPEPVTELSIVFEEGLQMLDQGVYSGPRYERETGIKINVVSGGDYNRITQFIIDSEPGEYDVVSVPPGGIVDVAHLLEPLDKYFDTPEMQKDLEDILPAFRQWGVYRGNRFAVVDDGDVLIGIHNKELVNGEDIPDNWSEYIDLAEVINGLYNRNKYGVEPYYGDATAAPFFEQRFCTGGGSWFDVSTMRATLNNQYGGAALKSMVREVNAARPGSNGRGFVEQLGLFQRGEVAMEVGWPPFARWHEGYGASEEALAWVPQSKISGKIGYFPMPGGRSILASGYTIGILKASKNKEAAWNYVKWLNSKEVSLDRTMNGASLRDPFRFSHFNSVKYRGLFASAPEYLDTLLAAIETAMPELRLYETRSYRQAVIRGIHDSISGTPLNVVLTQMESDFNSITDRIGVDKQREQYKNWLKIPNACKSDKTGKL